MSDSPKKWIKDVHETSDAMDIPEGLFTKSAKTIAEELKRIVLASDHTKGTKFQSAMSMLDFYINRAGKNLTQEDRERLEQAKVELRALFGKTK